jgi:hypothetical protein
VKGRDTEGQLWTELGYRGSVMDRARIYNGSCLDIAWIYRGYPIFLGFCRLLKMCPNH